MINELLDMTDRWNASQPAFKVVKVRLGRDFFCYNDNPNKPIIDKMNLSYDKHELAKIISYQQLELLFRPFKNHPSFKDFIRWWKFLITYVAVWAILNIVVLFLLRPYFSDKMFATLLIIYVILSLGLMAFPFYFEWKMKNAIKQFSKFCTSLSTQQTQFSIKMIKTKLERINQQYVEVEIPEDQFPLHYQIYICVQSKRFLQDNQYIKLYKSGGSNIKDLLCYSEERPIYKATIFSFDKRKLNKFISFEELQLLLRPFKANYYYQRKIFWNRFAFVSILCILLVIIPLLVFKNDPNLSLLIALSYTFFVYFWFVFAMCKSAKMDALMLLQLKEYCEKISLDNPRIDIILHLKDTKDKKSCINLHTSFYCLQIRLKERQQDIIT